MQYCITTAFVIFFYESVFKYRGFQKFIVRSIIDSLSVLEIIAK